MTRTTPTGRATAVMGPARARRAATDDGESGQITLLTLGFAVIAIALILVVASASSIHLERKRLLALADGAAADAADALDDERYYLAEPMAAAGVPLSDASVRAAVEAHLDAAMAGVRFDQLAIEGSTGTTDGRTAQVTLSAVARPPLVPWVLVPWADGFEIRVTSLADAE